MSTWQDNHRKGIAVSEISAIMGLNPFKSPIQVYMDKHGMSEETPDNLPMRMGRLLEPIIGQEFTRETGKPLTPGEITVHPTRPMIIGTPDFLVMNESAGVEAKSAGFLKHDEWGLPMTDNIPMHYLMQCHGYMAVTDRDEWFVALLVGGNREFRIYRVQRDRDIENRMCDFAEDWYQKHVLNGNAPELDATKSTDAYLKRMFPRHVTDDIRAATAEQMQLLANYSRARNDLKALEECTTLLENQIRAEIGDAAGIVGNGYKAMWKANRDSEVIDKTALIAACDPEFVKRFTTTKPGARVFRFSEEKQK